MQLQKCGQPGETIAAIGGNIDAGGGAKFYLQMMLAHGLYQMDSNSEHIRTGLDRSRAEDKKFGRLQTWTRCGSGRPNGSPLRTR